MFEEYIKNGTPEQKERAENWKIAIGLQDVDNLKVSQVLIELARRHIEGKITIEEVLEQNTNNELFDLIDSIYEKEGK